jgi:hypothetical protein
VRAVQPQLAKNVFSTPQVQTPAFRQADVITAKLFEGQLLIRVILGTTNQCEVGIERWERRRGKLATP